MQVGDCIISLGGISLQELDGDACEDAFAKALENRAKAVIESHCEARGELPAGMLHRWENLQADLNAFAADYEVRFELQSDSNCLVMSGARPAVTAARTHATSLLNAWIA